MDLENVTCIFIKSLVYYVGKKLETKLQHLVRYLHNKNILEYAQILVTDGRFMNSVIEVTLVSQITYFFHGCIIKMSIWFDGILDLVDRKGDRC